MSEERLLNFTELIAPLPGADPAGESPSIARSRLKKARDLIVMYVDNPNPPERPTEVEIPKWSDLRKMAETELRDKTKDLQVAAYLTEALFKTEGFRGLAGGLHLLSLLAEQCWDRMFPKMESATDLTGRTNVLSWLDSEGSGARFPVSINLWPLVQGSEKTFCCSDYQSDTEGFNQAKREAKLDLLQSVDEAIGKSQTEWRGLVAVLNGKMGGASPTLADLGKALDNCKRVVARVIKERSPMEGTAEDPDGDKNTANPEGDPSPVPRGSRGQAYQKLAEAAALLQKLEPHSPIPYLIFRAMSLQDKPFPTMIREFIEDEVTITKLYKELGVRPEKEKPVSSES